MKNNTLQKNWVIWSLSIYILFPILFFFIVGKFISLTNRGIISLDILLLMVFSRYLNNVSLTIVYCFLIAVELVTSSAHSYYFTIFDFIYSIKYLLQLNSGSIILLSLTLIIILLAWSAYKTFNRFKQKIPIWFSISLLFLFSLADVLNGSSSRFYLSLNKVQSTTPVIDYNIAGSTLLQIYFELKYQLSAESIDKNDFIISTKFRESISGLEIFDENKKPNICLIIMESFGINKDQNDYLSIIKPISNLNKNFIVELNKERFYGSTVSAETRELLGIKNISFRKLKYIDTTYSDYIIPKKLKSEGYKSYAFHGYSGFMFDRKHWWPNVGFDTSFFLEDYFNKNTKMFGSNFSGLSDKFLIHEIEEKIFSDKNDSPFFIYLLTLNAHLPLSKNLNAEYNILGFDTLTVTQIIDSVNYKLIQEISDLVKVSHNTWFFIVGDHPPPLGSELNKHYDNKFIPSIFIKPLKKN